jgi:hypothetical protein
VTPSASRGLTSLMIPSVLSRAEAPSNLWLLLEAFLPFGHILIDDAMSRVLPNLIFCSMEVSGRDRLRKNFSVSVRAANM